MWTLSYEIVFLFEFLKIYSDHMLKCHNFEIQWWWCIQVVILFHQVRIAWWIRWVIIINKNHPQLQVEQLKINDEENEKSKFNWLLLIYVNFTRSCLEIRMFYFVFVSLPLSLSPRPVFQILFVSVILALNFDVVFCMHLLLLRILLSVIVFSFH